MDKTFDYILQCEKAKKIQDRWNPQCGDLIFHRRPGKYESTFSYITKSDINGSKNLNNNWILKPIKERINTSRTKIIWLPSQDRLQEMVRKNLTSWQLTQKFWNWLWTKEEVTTDSSMEQLWLAFVMSEKFKKIWTGEEWRGADL